MASGRLSLSGNISSVLVRSSLCAAAHGTRSSLAVCRFLASRHSLDGLAVPALPSSVSAMALDGTVFGGRGLSFACPTRWLLVTMGRYLTASDRHLAPTVASLPPRCRGSRTHAAQRSYSSLSPSRPRRIVVNAPTCVVNLHSVMRSLFHNAIFPFHRLVSAFFCVFASALSPDLRRITFAGHLDLVRGFISVSPRSPQLPTFTTLQGTLEEHFSLNSPATNPHASKDLLSASKRGFVDSKKTPASVCCIVIVAYGLLATFSNNQTQSSPLLSYQNGYHSVRSGFILTERM